MIRVIIADDHALVRRTLRMLLEKTEDIEIIEEAKDGREAVKLAERLVPDVLVMDIVMPFLDGIQASEQICHLSLATQVVIVSTHSDETLVQQAFKKGAKGYVLKKAVVKELALAVRAAYQGQTYFSQSLTGLH